MNKPSEFKRRKVLLREASEAPSLRKIKKNTDERVKIALSPSGSHSNSTFQAPRHPASTGLEKNEPICGWVLLEL